MIINSHVVLCQQDVYSSPHYNAFHRMFSAQGEKKHASEVKNIRDQKVEES